MGLLCRLHEIMSWKTLRMQYKLNEGAVSVKQMAETRGKRLSLHHGVHDEELGLGLTAS